MSLCPSCQVCNHPFLVAEPRTRAGDKLSVAKPEALIEACGKLKLLDRMLKKLHRDKHRVLIFSQVGRSGLADAVGR